MKIVQNNSPSFGLNVVSHLKETEIAIKDNYNINSTEKRMLGRYSQMPDFDSREVVDFISPHFYDVLHEDPSFGTKNDARNNAMSRFLHYTRKAFREKNDREMFLRNIGYAVHYLQDASTPPHTEHGNYFHKLFRIPMHSWYEKGKTVGITAKLDRLIKNYTYENLSPSGNQSWKPQDMIKNLKQLFHNTALFTVQNENKISYLNIPKWTEIQQRCFDRGVNASKVYLDYMLQYIPK